MDRAACTRFAWFCVCLTIAAASTVTTVAQPKPPVPPVDRFADPLPSPDKAPFEKGKFALRDGEVVVLTGSANGVFEQQQGWLETLLTAEAAGRRPVFRNMCWEGDTVFEQARAMNFGGWPEQFQAVGTSTIFAWFGQLEALDDTKTVEQAIAAYAKLLDEFRATTPRLVVISPLPFEKPATAAIQDNTSRNERVRAFAEAARKLAAERGAIYVDVFTPLSKRAAGEKRLTDNGLHLTEDGQRIVAESISGKLIADGPGGRSAWSSKLEPLRQEIVAKNRLWFDCWRTMNWYFAYGDRTQTSFDKPAAGRPNLAKELEQFKPLLRAADARVQAVARGEAPPPLPGGTPEPPQKVHPPDEEQKTFNIRPGFDINLFASEADGLVKPIQICWDERGRLWAVCAPSYPQLVPGVKPNDYILVCEDTNGDGRVDKSFKYAEGLVMPTGLALGDGGVYVCEGTQLLHLRDTDGDGRADARRVVLSGFGTGDSHQCINSPCWGPDGCLWFTQGLHIFSLVETPRGLVRCHRTGVWRYNPRSQVLDHFLGNAAASENAWGVGFNDWGQTFYTPGNEPGVYYLDPAMVPLPIEKISTGQYRDIGKLAITGVKGMRTEFFSTRHLPDDLQGAYAKSVYIAGFVELHQFEDDASGFKSKDLGHLIQSPSAAFRPVETKVGPDGAIYVCDWYNPIIGHYQASYRDPNRDHTHGRVWRLTAKGRPLVDRPKLEGMSVTQLLDQLASPERWVRDQAHYLLAGMPAAEVTAATDAWLGRRALDDSTQRERLLYEALGVYAAHDAIRPRLIDESLASADPRLRAFATHMVGMWAAELPDALSLLRKLAADDAPRVRLEAIVSASYIRQPAAVEVATIALDKPRDKWIDYALTQTVRSLKDQWYPALVRGELKFDNRPERIGFVLEADGTKDVAGAIRLLAGNASLPENGREQLLALLANVGLPDDLRFALDRGGNSPLVLGELATAAVVRGKRPGGNLVTDVKKLLDQPDGPLRAAGVRLAGAWKLKELAGDVRKLLEQPQQPATTEVALAALAILDERAALEIVSQFATSTQPISVQSAAIGAVSSLDVNRGALFAAELIGQATNEAQMSQLVTPLLLRRDGSAAFAKALSGKPPTSDSALLVYRVLTAAGDNDATLAGVLHKAMGARNEVLEYSAELVKLLTAGATSGDAQRGREVYQSKIANCSACHKVAGHGGDIGPELSNIGKQLPPQQIVESVLWPNRVIKEGYMAIRVVTDDGLLYTGYKLKESGEEFQLREASTGQVRRFARASIEDTANAGSVMPAGLAASMTRQELHDLIRYLSELGRAATAN